MTRLSLAALAALWAARKKMGEDREWDKTGMFSQCQPENVWARPFYVIMRD